MRISLLFAPPNRQFVITNTVVVPAIINIVIAVILTHILFHPDQPVPLWGDNGAVIDLIMSSLFASIITGFIALLTTRAKCKSGHFKLSSENILSGYREILARHPRKMMLAAALLIFLAHCIALNSLGTIIFGTEPLAWTPFIIIKVIQAIFLSLLGASIGTWLAVASHTYSLNKSQA